MHLMPTPKKKGRPPADTEQISFRVSRSLIKRAQKVAEAMRLDGSVDTTSSVYRTALQRGLEELEAEHGIRENILMRLAREELAKLRAKSAKPTRGKR